MGKKIKIQVESITFESQYNPMATSAKKKPKVIALHALREAKQRTKVIKSGVILKQGDTCKVWVDHDDDEISKDTVTFHLEDPDTQELSDPIDKVSQSRVFIGEKFDSDKSYTDEFIIDKYFELSPSDGNMEKDVDRAANVGANSRGMYQLWKRLYENNEVVMGEFNPSSAGFITSYGYIRAVQFDGSKWGLEIGVFKERKTFKHLQDGEPQVIQASVKKKVSMI